VTERIAARFVPVSVTDWAPAAGPLASVSVPGPRWVSDCIISCRTTPDVSVLGYLGNVAESDPLFTTIVRIPGGLG